MTNLRNVNILSPVTAFGDLRNAELSPIFQQSFEYTVDNTDLTLNTVVAGGTVTQADAMAVLGTSTTTASSALLQTRVSAKYHAGFGSLFRFTALFTSGVTAAEQYVGLADEIGSSEAFKNGYMIGFDGDTFGFHRFQNDVKITVAQTGWDDPLDGSGASGMTLDPTKLNVWAISFRYLGAGRITLLVENESTGDFVEVHRILYANLNTVPSVFNPNFHGTLWADNKGTTSDLILKTGSLAFFIEGKTAFTELQRHQKSTDFQTKNAVTTEIAILTIRNKTTYASKTNFLDILLENIVGSVEASAANNLAEIRLIKNATLGGTPSYSDINTTNSIVELDISGTTVTGGETLLPVPLAGKNDKVIDNLVPFRILIHPGDTITVSGTSAGSATMKASLLWKELF